MLDHLLFKSSTTSYGEVFISLIMSFRKKKILLPKEAASSIKILEAFLKCWFKARDIWLPS